MEETSAPAERIAWRWGYDFASDCAWESDHCGCSSALELDDRELLLLAGLVRSGHWLKPATGRLLSLSLDAQPPDAALEAVVAEPLAALAGGGPPPLRLSLRLQPHGRLDARLAVCRATGRPLTLTLRVGGDAEGWAYGGWHLGGPQPGLAVHCTAAGSRDLFRADGGSATPLPLAAACPPPGSLGSTAGASWLAPGGGELALERSGSGHLLVRMALGDAPPGLAILDTGASGFVICRAAADAAGAEAFGCVHVAGTGARVPSRYRRCPSVTVGPLRFDAPLMLELELAGLVWGASGPAIGIVGYDLFRRAVVSIPAAPGAFAHLAPAACEPAPLPAPAWLGVALLSNVPHVYARWHGSHAHGPAELLMLDTGAGGADCIFHARTVARLDLSAVGTYAGASSLRGVGASGGAPTRADAMPTQPTQRRRLDWVELLASAPSVAQPQPRAVHFQRIDALLLGAPGTFDLSVAMSGVVAMALVARHGIVCDLYRRRVGVYAPPDGARALDEDDVTIAPENYL